MTGRRYVAVLTDAMTTAVVVQRLPVALHAVPALAEAAAGALPHNTPAVHTPLTTKPRATPDDARAIARRMEAHDRERRIERARTHLNGDPT